MGRPLTLGNIANATTRTFFGDFTDLRDVLEADGSDPDLPAVNASVDFATGEPYPADDFWGVTGAVNFREPHTLRRYKYKLDWPSRCDAGEEGSGHQPCTACVDGGADWGTESIEILEVDGEVVVPDGGYDPTNECATSEGGLCGYETECCECLTTHDGIVICGLYQETESNIGGTDCPQGWDNESRFNPETDGVDSGYWTGDINSYSLVVWRCPLADTTALYDIATQCQGGINIFCEQSLVDNKYVWGGRPAWLDAVLTGNWSGRLVILTNAAHGSSFDEDIDGSEGSEFPSYNPGAIGTGIVIGEADMPRGSLGASDRSAAFLADIELPIIVHPVVRQLDSEEGFGYDNPARIAAVQECDLTVLEKNENGEPISYITELLTAFPPHLESGGGAGVIETIATCEMKWIEYCNYWQGLFTEDFDCTPSGVKVSWTTPGGIMETEPTTCGMRATILKENGKRVDIVIVPDAFVCSDRNVSRNIQNTDYDVERKQFIRNLFQVPLKPRSELEG